MAADFRHVAGVEGIMDEPKRAAELCNRSFSAQSQETGLDRFSLAQCNLASKSNFVSV